MNDAPETMPTSNADSAVTPPCAAPMSIPRGAKRQASVGSPVVVVPHILIEDPLKVMAPEISIQSRYSSRTVRTQRSG